jgi:hypothetical protein
MFPVRSSRRTRYIGKYSLVAQQLRMKHCLICAAVGMSLSPNLTQMSRFYGLYCSWQIEIFIVQSQD